MVDLLTGCDEPKFLDLEPETDENRWNIEDKSRYNGSNYLADWFTSIILEKWTRKIKDNFVCFRRKTDNFLLKTKLTIFKLSHF